jgi:hypothetical protein
MTPAKLILLSSFLFYTFIIYAQERQNAPDISFIKKSEKLVQATGWYQTVDGKWVDHQNIITPRAKPDTATSYASFYWFQSASFNYKSQKYYLFFYEDLRGEFRLPASRQDWYTFHQVSFIILNSNAYTLLKDAVNKKTGKTVNISSKMDVGKVQGTYDEGKFLKQISISLAETNPSQYSVLSINSQNLKGQDIIRFLLPHDRSSLDKSDYLATQYFEVPTAEFKKLLID